jgi:hypothetical protein
MDYAFARGINIFDAAEIYPVPPKPETQGRTEAIIGTWLAARKTRDKVLIATKAVGRSAKFDWLRKDGSLRQSAAHSLRRPRPTISISISCTGRTGRCGSSRGSTMCISRATPTLSMRFSARWGDSWQRARCALSVCPTRRLGA